MKRLLILLVSGTFLCSLASVSCAKAAPAFTAGIENATVHISDGGNSDGAICSPNVNFDLTHISLAIPVIDLRLAKIHWCRDEWFYSMGYKAKLSDAVEELIAPPDQNNLNPEYPLKYC